MRTSKKISVIVLSAALVFSQTAFAARVGQKRNLGMKRTTTSYQSNNTVNNSNNGYRNQSYQQAQPNGQAAGRTGPGVGSVVAGAAAGAAVGAVGGYMLGKAMNSSDTSKMASSQVASQSQEATQKAPSAPIESKIPWGIITILALLLIIGLMIFRRKGAPQVSNQVNSAASMNNGNNNFDIPNIRRENIQYNMQDRAQTTQAAPIVEPINRVADGVETAYFLRQAKGMFQHIQSMNTPENVNEVAKYMTPDLYAEIRELISSNDYVADFSQLDCTLIESTEENGNYVASVRFFGLVSDAPGNPATPFSEIWHFVKPVGQASAKWLVAGIQQETNA